MAKDRGYAVGALAAQPMDDDDEILLRQVAAMYDELDPLPDGLVDRLQFAMTLDALHAEIARIERMDDLVGARSEGVSEVQTVTFSTSNTTTTVSITPAGADRVRIDGWAAEGAGWLVELRTDAERFTTHADEDGRFVFESVPRGLAQFVLRQPDGSAPPVVTPSLTI